MVEKENKSKILRLDLTESPRTIVKYKTGEDTDVLFGHIKDYPAVRSDIIMFIMSNALMNGRREIVFSPKQLKNFIGYRQSSSNKDFQDAIHAIFKDLSTVGYETQELSKDGHQHTVFRPFFSKTDIDNTTHQVTVQLGERAAMIFNAFSRNSRFNRFSLLQYFQISSKYSKNLFRLLKEKRVYGHRRFSEAELRDKLSIPESYKPGDISRRVIKRGFIDLMPYFKGFDYSIENIRSSTKPTSYIFSWVPEKHRQKDAYSDPNIPKLIASYNILTNPAATDTEKCTAMDRYFRLTRGKYKKLNAADSFAFLKLIYGEDLDDGLIHDVKKADPQVLQFLLDHYTQLRDKDKLNAAGMATLTLLEAERDRRKKVENKFKDPLDLTGIRQNTELHPEWANDPSYTVLCATKRLKPLELYSPDEINFILQAYVKALADSPKDAKLLQDIGVISAYLRKA